MELLYDLTVWHWLGFGLLLIAVEVFGVGGYFLWLGVAAITTGLLLATYQALGHGFSWHWQVTFFSCLSVVTASLWWWRLKARPLSGEPVLNNRGQHLIGQAFVLCEGISEPGGVGRVKIGDTTWRVTGDMASTKELVRVTAVRGTTLIVTTDMSSG